MSKGNGFFGNLKKSTRITLVSCGCFIALTAAILLFFVMFPITPSEKMISSLGRESIYRQDTDSTSVPATASVTTTVTTAKKSAKSTRTTTYSRTSGKDFTITFTHGAGFYMGSRIPTGVFPNEYYVPTTTTTSVEGGTLANGEVPTSNGEQPTTGAGGTGVEIPTNNEGGPGVEVITPIEGGSGGSGGENQPPAIDGSAAVN